MTPAMQTQVLAYHQRCEYEDQRRDVEFAKAGVGHMAGGRAKRGKR